MTSRISPLVDSSPYHPRTTRDAVHILQRHCPNRTSLTRRRNAIEELRKIFANYADGRFQVVEISPGPFGIGTDSIASQLVIQDSLPYSITTAWNEEYSARPSVVQHLIQQASFVVPDIPAPSATSRRAGIVPPLFASRDELEYEVHPPSPFQKPFQRLLQAHIAHYPLLKIILPLVDLWVRSNGIPTSQISPDCIAIMVISVLQQHFKLDSFLSVNALKAKEDSESVHWPKNFPATGSPPRDLKAIPSLIVDTSIRAKASLSARHPLNGTSLGEILSAFFASWVRPSHPYIVSVDALPPTLVERDAATTQSTIGRRGAQLSPPSGWRKAPLVVQDPFLITHNHAQRLSTGNWDRFRQACVKSANSLHQTAPLHTLFGPDIKALPFPGGRTPSEVFNQGIRTSIAGLLTKSDDPMLSHRKQCIATITEIVRKNFGSRFKVECFGSTVYGVDSRSSDLDLTILDSELPFGFPPGTSSQIWSLPEPYDMNKLARLVRQAGFQEVTAITKAHVPLVKFVDPRANLNIDLSCNNRLGCVKTDFMAAYCEAWSPLRSMICFLKRWAKTWGLNDPSGSDGPVTLSSWAISLMTIAFLQLQGVLPNLQSSSVDGFFGDKNHNGLWISWRNDSRVWCDTRFDPGTAHKSPVELDLLDAIYGWFKFFAYGHKYDQHILDVKRGKLVKRERALRFSYGAYSTGLRRTSIIAGSGQPSEWAESRLVVVDPFSGERNCVSACKPDVLERFQQECQRTTSLMETGEPTEVLLGDGSPIFYGLAGQAVRPRAPSADYIAQGMGRLSLNAPTKLAARPVRARSTLPF